MASILADTGPLYALADPSDQFHARAVGELESFKERGLAVAATYPTLCEAYTLILRRLGTNYAHQWLAEMLAGAVLLNPEPGDYVQGSVELDRYSDRSITLVDAVTAVMSGKLSMPVWSYDRHFAIMKVKLRP
jgi:predicted nucleic acid-binding protein